MRDFVAHVEAIRIETLDEKTKWEVWIGQEQLNEGSKGRMNVKQGRKNNKWGEVDWSSNPSEVQTALRGVMALRRREQARRTSRDSTPTEHPVKHCPTPLTSLKTFTNTPVGPAHRWNTPPNALLPSALLLPLFFCSSPFHETQKRRTTINKSGEFAAEC